jgi:hypothetical protein
MPLPEKQPEIDASEQSDDPRTRAREAQAAFRERRRHGMVLVQIAVTRAQAAALERLGLYDPDGGGESLAWAAAHNEPRVGTLLLIIGPSGAVCALAYRVWGEFSPCIQHSTGASTDVPNIAGCGLSGAAGSYSKTGKWLRGRRSQEPIEERRSRTLLPRRCLWLNSA